MHSPKCFSAALDTFHTEILNGVSTSIRDTGVYVVSHDKVQLVARSGSVIPGVGTIADLENPFFVGANNALLFGGAVINDLGQVAFQAILTDGRDALLIASSAQHGDHQDSGNDDSDAGDRGHRQDSSSDKKHDDDDVLHRSGNGLF